MNTFFYKYGHVISSIAVTILQDNQNAFTRMTLSDSTFSYTIQNVPFASKFEIAQVLGRYCRIVTRVTVSFFYCQNDDVLC